MAYSTFCKNKYHNILMKSISVHACVCMALNDSLLFILTVYAQLLSYAWCRGPATSALSDMMCKNFLSSLALVAWMLLTFADCSSCLTDLKTWNKFCRRHFISGTLLRSHCISWRLSLANTAVCNRVIYEKVYCVCHVAAFDRSVHDKNLQHYESTEGVDTYQVYATRRHWAPKCKHSSVHWYDSSTDDVPWCQVTHCASRINSAVTCFL